MRRDAGKSLRLALGGGTWRVELGALGGGPRVWARMTNFDAHAAGPIPMSNAVRNINSAMSFSSFPTMAKCTQAIPYDAALHVLYSMRICILLFQCT